MTGRLVFVHTAGVDLPPEERTGTDIAVADIFDQLCEAGLDVHRIAVRPNGLGAFRRHFGGLWQGAPPVVLDRTSDPRSASEVLRPSDRIVLADDYAGLFLRRGWNPAVLVRHNALHWSYAQRGPETLFERLRNDVYCWEARRFDQWTSRRALAVLAPGGTTEHRLRALVPDARILPWYPRVPLRAEGPLPVRPGPAHRGIFFANFAYLPNLEALRWLCAEIAPRLAGTGRVIEVCGPGSREAASQLEVPSCIEITGFQPDLVAAAAQADFGIIPIRKGEGILLKSLQMLGYGLPTVATALSVAGTGAKESACAVLAETAEEFLAAIASLDAPERREELGRRAWEQARTFNARSGIVPSILKGFEPNGDGVG